MDITTYFESDDFLNIISPLGRYVSDSNDIVNILNIFTKVGINYWRLFSTEGISVENINNFMKKAVSKYEELIKDGNLNSVDNFNLNHSMYDLYIDELVERGRISKRDLDDPTISQVLRNFVVDNLTKHDKFHAFNGSFLESIMENGVNPNFKFENQEELDMIDSIFSGHGCGGIFGWQGLNCKNLVSYAGSPDNSYYYAVNSPEWFSQFTGAGTFFNPPEKYVKDAFVRRDFDGASNNLMMLMSEKNFSQQEIELVMIFFNKYWDLYVNQKSDPMVAIIPCDEATAKVNSEKIVAIPSVREKLDNAFVFCLGGKDNDARSSSAIDTSKALFVKFPSISRVMEKINVDDKEKSSSVKK